MNESTRFTMSRWKCRTCGFKTQILQEAVAQIVHQTAFPDCSSGLLLDEAQQTAFATGSIAGPGHLESDDAVALPPIRLGHPEPNSSKQPFGRSEDEGSVGQAFNPWNQLGSDDVVYQRDKMPEERERSQATDQQPISSRIEKATRIIKQFQCAICREEWRSTATTLCRHLVCCSTCFQRQNQNCMVCRGKVATSFPVEFHSSTLLNSLHLTFPLTEIIGIEELQVFLDMGFSENEIRRAIRLIQHRNSSEALPDFYSVVDFIISNPFPVPDEMELLLDDENVDDTVKCQICDYLEIISKCLVCRHNFPSICLNPCQHLALCRECFERQPRPKKCPDCGNPIENQVAIYLP